MEIAGHAWLDACMHNSRVRVLNLAPPLGLLVVWELCAHFGAIDTRFFPAPSSICGALAQMLRPSEQFPQGELLAHVSISLQRIAVGFVIGALPGIALGLAIGLSAHARALVQPLIDATFPIPKIAVLPLFILIFGIGEQSKYAIIAVAVMYLVVINTAAGVRGIDRVHLEVARSFRASRWMMFRDVALLGALPSIFTGLKLGLGMALLVIVSAEFVGARSGIGYLIWTSWQVFQVEKMYVGLITTALLGFAAAVLLAWLETVLVPWRRT